MVEKYFAILKYQDREILMMEKELDFSFSLSLSDSLEREAESLKLTRSHLADISHSHNNNKDISGTTNLFPMEPHRISGVIISGHSQNYTNLGVEQCIWL